MWKREFNETNLTDFFHAQMQGDIFALSTRLGFDSEKFIEIYMNSRVASDFDSPYSRVQWSGEYYAMDELKKEYPDLPTGTVWDADVMYWIGYIYRYWHYLTDASSREIYKIADGEKMLMRYPAGHTFSEEKVVGDLIGEKPSQVIQSQLPCPK